MSSENCNQARTWNELKFGDEIYMICAIKENDKFNILLTNLVELWAETLTKDATIQRCRELNKLLNVDSLDCNQIVGTILNDICSHIVEANKEKIQLHRKIEDITFKFAIHLRKASPEEFCEIVTKPVCISSMELMRQCRILLDLIKKKDEEIAEYKAEGAELIRKNIETKPFNEEYLNVRCHSQDKPNYSKIFQGIISFYNDHELSKYTLGCSIVSTSNTKRSGEEVVTKCENGPMSAKKQAKKSIANKIMRNNSRHMTLPQRRSKRSNTGLDRFI